MEVLRRHIRTVLKEHRATNKLLKSIMAKVVPITKDLLDNFHDIQDAGYSDYRSKDVPVGVFEAFGRKLRVAIEFKALDQLWRQRNVAGMYMPKEDRGPNTDEDLMIIYLHLESDDAWLDTFEQLYFMILETVKHELEHMHQTALRGGSEDEIIEPPAGSGLFGTDKEAHAEQMLKYLMQPAEIEAWVEGMYNRAKKRRQPIRDMLKDREHFLRRKQHFDDDQIRTVIDAWTDRIRERYPNAQL